MRRFFKNLIRVVKWVPILWDNQEWDHSYFLQIIQHKIKLMREYHTNYGVTSDRGRTIHQMRVAELLLDRVIKDNYCAEGYDKYHNARKQDKWLEDKSGLRKLPPLTDEEYKELKKLSTHEELQRKQDLELFAKYFVRHVTSWWD